MHYKIQSGGGNDETGLIDPHDPDGSRERLIKAREAAGMDMVAVMDAWAKIVRESEKSRLYMQARRLLVSWQLCEMHRASPSF
jgi:hypothetical protein